MNSIKPNDSTKLLVLNKPKGYLVILDEKQFMIFYLLGLMMMDGCQ